jgi:hypothetical protein
MGNVEVASGLLILNTLQTPHNVGFMKSQFRMIVLWILTVQILAYFEENLNDVYIPG